MVRSLLILLLLALVAPVVASAQPQVPEIPSPGLGDIAMVTWRNGQVVILYDPIVCQQMGPPLCQFFRAHEYGHVALGHAIVPTFPPKREHDADCWAARNAHPAELVAAIRYFAAGGAGATWSHGTGPQRAQRIVRCASGRPGFTPPEGRICCTGVTDCALPTWRILADSCSCWTRMGFAQGAVCR